MLHGAVQDREDRAITPGWVRLTQVTAGRCVYAAGRPGETIVP
jgi:hypothetical protein